MCREGVVTGGGRHQGGGLPEVALLPLASPEDRGGMQHGMGMFGRARHFFSHLH